jgi:hypothetical protein
LKIIISALMLAVLMLVVQVLVLVLAAPRTTGLVLMIARSVRTSEAMKKYGARFQENLHSRMPLVPTVFA